MTSPAYSCRGQHEGNHRDVIVLPKRLCGPGDLFGWLAAEYLRTFEAEEFTFLVAGFDHAVGQKSQAVTRRDAHRCLGILGFRDTQWQPGNAFDFTSTYVRCQVAGVGEGKNAGAGELDAQARDEPIIAPPKEFTIQPGQQFRWTKAFTSERTQRTDCQGAGHGGLETLAADVANHHH